MNDPLSMLIIFILMLLSGGLWLIYTKYFVDKLLTIASNPLSASDLVDLVDDILPQTQCGQCGYMGCRPYAKALVYESVPVNRCPPGDEAGIHDLAALLGRPFVPFDGGVPYPKPKAVAWIDENTCIGCTLCIQACPVDAILGAPKRMHTILQADCTGCELCIAPCPVDCIQMLPLETLEEERQQRLYESVIKQT